MKRFLAAMTMLFVSVLAIWVAFRLAPETWAMIAGVVFGLVATLPMCAIVLVLLLRGHGQDRRPAEPTYYAQQPMIVMNAEPGPSGRYWVEPTPGRRQLPAAPPAPARRPYRAPEATAGRSFVDRTQEPYGYPPEQSWDDAPDVWDDAVAGDVEPDGPPIWERPAPGPRGARILG